jgi:predicted DNA-binding protein with PD1-like motif
MQAKLLHNIDGLRTFAVVLDKRDDVTEGLLRFAAQHKVTGAQLSAIGALEQVTLGYFDRDRKDYAHIEIREQVEVLSFTGNIALKDGKPKLHAHIVIGKADGTALGGHLLQARVWPTLEIMIVETPEHLRRTFDAETGLALLNLAA